MVRYYRKGNTVLEDGDPDEVEAAEAEVQSILQGLEDGDEETYERVAEVVDTVLGGMQNTLGRLPAEFDEFVKETKFMRNGDTDDLVDRLKGLDCAVYGGGCLAAGPARFREESPCSCAPMGPRCTRLGT